MKEILLAIPSIVSIGSANAILKWRLIYLNQQGIRIFSSKFFNFLFDPFIFSGALATLFAIIWWLSIISHVRIGVVYPVIQAGAIVVTLLLSTLLLKETINTVQFIAISLIVTGIILLSTSN